MKYSDISVPESGPSVTTADSFCGRYFQQYTFGAAAIFNKVVANWLIWASFLATLALMKRAEEEQAWRNESFSAAAVRVAGIYSNFAYACKRKGLYPQNWHCVMCL